MYISIQDLGGFVVSIAFLAFLWHGINFLLVLLTTFGRNVIHESQVFYIYTLILQSIHLYYNIQVTNRKLHIYTHTQSVPAETIYKLSYVKE